MGGSRFLDNLAAGSAALPTGARFLVYRQAHTVGYRALFGRVGSRNSDRTGIRQCPSMPLATPCKA